MSTSAQWENFIKAGALDCLGATRKQMMSVYMRIMDDLQSLPEERYGRPDVTF